MDLARYVVDAVVLEGRSYREVAGAHGVSKSWVAKLVRRFRSEGYEGIEPRSRAPNRIPHRTSADLEDEVIRLRKELGDLGLDAGAQTIHYHLGLRHDPVPSVSTKCKILRRREFITPQPHKRPSVLRQKFLDTNEGRAMMSHGAHRRGGGGFRDRPDGTPDMDAIGHDHGWRGPSSKDRPGGRSG